MKKIIRNIVISCGLLLCCTTYSFCMTPDGDMFCTKGKYLVYKIDSIGDFYLIYVSQGAKRYKIVSSKDTTTTMHRRQIRVGHTYRFKLASLQAITPTINGIYMLEVNYLDSQYVHGNTPIGIDGFGIRTLYYPQNLQGLTLIRHKSVQQGPYGLIDWGKAMKACKKSSHQSTKD